MGDTLKWDLELSKKLGLDKNLKLANKLGISGGLSLLIAFLLWLKGRKRLANIFSGFGFALLFKWRDLRNGKHLSSLIGHLEKSH